MVNRKRQTLGGILLILMAAERGVAEGVGDVGALNVAFSTIEEGMDLIVPDEDKEKDLRVRLGAGFGTTPKFKGSDDYRLKVVPIVDIRYKKRLRLSYNKLSYSAHMRDGWQIGPFIKYKGGRKEKRSPLLAGLGDIKSTAQLGVFAKYKTKRMLFNVEYRQALGAGQGSSVSATFGHALCKFGDFVMAAAISGKWLSKKAMQTNFGVTEAQSAASKYGLKAFEADSGVSEMSVNLLGRYSIGKRTRILALARYGRLMGDAAISPLVTHDLGNRNQFKVGAGFTVDF